jgi:chromosome segregation ATPase
LKGIIIWILGFFSFLAASNVINAVIMWFSLGAEGTFTPSLLGGLTGPIPVYVYLLISVIATLAFLGATSHMLVREFSTTDQISALAENVNRLETSQQAQQRTLDNLQDKMLAIEGSLERTRNELSKSLSEQGDAVKQSLETSHEAHQKLLETLQNQAVSLDESLTAVKKGLGGHTKEIKEVSANLAQFGPQVADVKETVTKQLGEMGTALAQHEQRQKRTAATITKQRTEIAEIKLKLEKIEEELAKPQPLLTSQSNVEEVNGIGPKKGTALKEIEIANVGEFIMADPKVAAEKMGASEKTVEKLQKRAQLSMVPGLKDTDIFLLEEAGITDRKSLAEQDPIELSKKINAIFKTNVEKKKVSEEDKPTIEEIDSWVKSA